MIEISRTQDEEVGDGTTSVIILGELRPILLMLTLWLYITGWGSWFHGVMGGFHFTQQFTGENGTGFHFSQHSADIGIVPPLVYSWRDVSVS